MLAAVVADLEDESAALDAVVARLTGEQWQLATPAAGWTIAHQIAHLAWTDELSLRAVSDPDGSRDALSVSRITPDHVDARAAEGVTTPPAHLLQRWRDSRAALAEALRGVPEGTRIPWVGPPMSATSMATARLMETWAHGQDVADTLGIDRAPTDRLRHVAHLGVRTRDFAYSIRRLTPPAEPFRVELVGPSGDLWAWGPDDAPQRVTGPALDFCLLVTQRRHRSELNLHATGTDADTWLGVTQAFAGAPGPGRERTA